MAPSLPWAILWCLNLCIICHLAFYPCGYDHLTRLTKASGQGNLPPTGKNLFLISLAYLFSFEFWQSPLPSRCDPEQWQTGKSQQAFDNSPKLTCFREMKKKKVRSICRPKMYRRKEETALVVMKVCKYNLYSRSPKKVRLG